MRLIASVVAIGGLLAGVVGAGNPASAGVDGQTFSGDQVPVDLRWVPCFADAGPGFECATARVPLDYDNLDGGKIPIDMVRLVATGERKGSLFLNPGGPGGSGIDFVLGAGPILFTPEVRAAYDLVGFDPRGILRSNPLLCFGTLNAALQAFPPFAFPTNDAEEEQQRASFGFLQTQCGNRGGIIQHKMSSANVARDMEVMRAAVGDEQLNFAGYSYGSVLGQVYANLFPDRVGHVIIDGVLDIADWVGDTGPLVRDDQTLGERLRSDVGAEDTFDEFFRQCEAAGPDACPLAPNADERGRLVLERLRAEPFVIVDPNTGEPIFAVTYADVVGMVLGGLYSTPDWIEIGIGLAQVEAAQNAPASPPPGFAAAMRRFDEAMAVRRPDPKYPNFVEGFPGVACVDTSNPINFRAWSEAVDRLEVESPTFGPIWGWSESICNQWPGDDRDRFVGPFGQTTANPLLLLTTLYDPATPVEQARSAHDAMPGSILVTVDGAGHTTLFTSTCVDDLTAAFLLDDIAPQDGTVCDQDLSLPFTDPGQAAQQARTALLRQQRHPGS